MHGDSNILFIVCAGIAALLSAIPLPKAIASGNVGTSMLLVWTELACLFQFANAVRWNGNVNDWAPIWCDIFGYFIVAADMGLVGAAVAINRRLYMIVTLDPRRRQRGLNMVVDVVFCFVIPLVSIALEYIVQQYRYYIFEDVGCVPGVGSVDLAFPLVWALPLLVGSISTGYACRTIHVSLQQSYKAMGDPGHSIGWSRRLMAIAVLSFLYALIPTSMAIALTAKAYPVTPWPGWKSIHSTIGDVVYVPAREWRKNSTTIASVELRRWTIVSIAYVDFLFLGLTPDMKKMYCAPFRGITGRVFSNSQTGAKPELENLSAHPQGKSSFLAPSKETYAGRRQSNLDSNLDSIELALPLAVTRSMSSQKIHP